MNVISLFSGAGGLDLGLEKAGFKTRLCVEIDADARATIRRNRPEWNPTDKHGGDITKFTASALLKEAGLRAGEVDVICGGPPCQSFSNLGRKGGLDDARGQLVFQYLRIVRDIRPKFCFFENVEGLLNHKPVLDALTERFKRYGYSFELIRVNAADFGVPQIRRRVVGIAIKGDTLIPLPVPTHADPKGLEKGRLPWVTVGEALAGLPQSYRTRSDNFVMNHAPYMVRRMKLIKPGENFKSLPLSELPECWRNGRHQGADTFGRLDADRPSVTIRTSGFNPTKGRYIHPSEDRGLSTLEMACLQSFPFEWRFEGGIGSVGRQIGNAVPPQLAYHIAAAVIGRKPSRRIAKQLAMFQGA